MVWEVVIGVTCGVGMGWKSEGGGFVLVVVVVVEFWETKFSSLFGSDNPLIFITLHHTRGILHSTCIYQNAFAIDEEWVEMMAKVDVVFIVMKKRLTNLTIVVVQNLNSSNSFQSKLIRIDGICLIHIKSFVRSMWDLL